MPAPKSDAGDQKKQEFDEMLQKGLERTQEAAKQVKELRERKKLKETETQKRSEDAVVAGREKEAKRLEKRDTFKREKQAKEGEVEAMKKKHELEFALLDTGDSVKAVLADGKRILLDYENEEAKVVRVRVPLPKKEHIIESAKYWLEHDNRWKSVEHHVDFYIQCREKEICEQVQEIRKCLKRIKRYSLRIEIANDAVREDQAKRV